MTPRDYGLPPKFSSWRTHQEETVERICATDKRFVLVSAPTGSGKSPIGVAAALSSRSKTTILTQTKALQDQYLADFAEIGLTDLRGQSSFECAVDRRLSVDDAQCHFGYACGIRNECAYYTQFTPALESPLVITNYAFWMTSNDRTNEPGAADKTRDEERESRAFNARTRFLLLDEGHLAHSSLLSHLATEIERSEIDRLGLDIPRLGSNTLGWKKWAGEIIRRIRPDLEGGALEIAAGGEYLDTKKYHTLNRLRKLNRLLETVRSMDGDWRTGHTKTTLRFEPILPSRARLNTTLFGAATKILIVSATLQRSEAERLRLSPSEYEYIEVPCSFPAYRRPFVPLDGPRVTYKTTDSEMIRSWAPLIDAIIRGRLDRKGIVHTISFQRRDLLMEHSAYRDFFFTNPFQHPLQSVVDAFKAAPPPAILVSPSLAQGYDFPGEQCSYQIIGKVPFPSIGSDAMKARMKEDPEIIHEITMQSLVQMAGRGVRSSDDICEIFIVDSFFSAWYNKHKKLAPEWFREAVQRPRGTIPRALSLTLESPANGSVRGLEAPKRKIRRPAIAALI